MGSATPDPDLVRRVARGDASAFNRLMERHLPMMRRFADRRLPARLRRRVSVSDVLQETQIVALERCAEFEDRGDEAFPGWLRAIVENKIREEIRRHEGTARRSIERETRPGDRMRMENLRGGHASPSQAAIGAEAERIAQGALRRLPEEHQQVLHLVRTEGLSLREAAARLGRTYDATRQLMSRALKRYLAEFLEMRGDTSR